MSNVRTPARQDTACSGLRAGDRNVKKNPLGIHPFFCNCQDPRRIFLMWCGTKEVFIIYQTKIKTSCFGALEESLPGSLTPRNFNGDPFLAAAIVERCVFLRTLRPIPTDPSFTITLKPFPTWTMVVEISWHGPVKGLVKQDGFFSLGLERAEDFFSLKRVLLFV